MQYLFGVASFIMSLALPLAFLTWRLFQRSQFHITWKVALAAFATEVVVVGNGLFFFLMTDSYTVLGFHLFLPLIVGGATMTMIQWIQNDYYFFSHNNIDEVQCACLEAEQRLLTRTYAPLQKEEICCLLPRDWLMLLGSIMTLLFILGLSLFVALGTDSRFGWTVGVIIFIPLMTYVSIKEYFNTFEFSWTFFISIVLQVNSYAHR